MPSCSFVDHDKLQRKVVWRFMSHARAWFELLSCINRRGLPIGSGWGVARRDWRAHRRDQPPVCAAVAPPVDDELGVGD